MRMFTAGIAKSTQSRPNRPTGAAIELQLTPLSDRMCRSSIGRVVAGHISLSVDELGRGNLQEFRTRLRRPALLVRRVHKTQGATCLARL